MNCLKSSLSKDGAVAARAGAKLGAATGASGGGVGVGTRNAARAYELPGVICIYKWAEFNSADLNIDVSW